MKGLHPPQKGKQGRTSACTCWWPSNHYYTQSSAACFVMQIALTGGWKYIKSNASASLFNNASGGQVPGALKNTSTEEAFLLTIFLWDHCQHQFIFFLPRATDCISSGKLLSFKGMLGVQWNDSGTRSNQLQLRLPVVPRCCKGRLAFKFAMRQGWKKVKKNLSVPSVCQ